MSTIHKISFSISDWEIVILYVSVMAVLVYLILCCIKYYDYRARYKRMLYTNSAYRRIINSMYGVVQEKGVMVPILFQNDMTDEKKVDAIKSILDDGSSCDVDTLRDISVILAMKDKDG